MAYINEIESLRRRMYSEMFQQKITRYIIKGLKPNIIRYIRILDNINKVVKRQHKKI
jgi:hypothetical protein